MYQLEAQRLLTVRLNVEVIGAWSLLWYDFYYYYFSYFHKLILLPAIS